MMNTIRTICGIMVGLFASAAECSPVEVGAVTWGRDLEVALRVSGATSRPVFALFQEVPGCAGCQQFGKEVLSNPHLVALIETEFVPLLIHNNKPGKDAEVLRQFGEPAWNYQVVRFLDAEGKDIIPRRDRVWDTGGIAERMIATLEKSKRPIPSSLTLLAAEHSAVLQRTSFSMYCFWTGEMVLGQLDGVVTTRAGFHDGLEVVEVSFDPEVIALPSLIAEAERHGCRHLGFVDDFRSAPRSDQKKQLQGTKLAGLNLSAAQATKVNAWVRADPNRALAYLTPTQRKQIE